VLLIDTERDFIPVSIPVPSFRKLIKISGTLKDIRMKLKKLDNTNHLNSFIQVVLAQEQYNAEIIFQFDELVTNFDKPGFEIVKHRTGFTYQQKGASEIYQNTIQLEDLSPREVFLELINKHEYDEETQQELLGAFDELLEEVQQDFEESI